MFTKIDVFKIWKKSLKICVKELILIQVKSSSSQFYYKTNSFTCIFKGAPYLELLFIFQKHKCSIKASVRQSAINRSSLKCLKSNCLKASCERVWLYKVAGIYQFFPKKSAGSQIFLKHLF